MDIEIKQTTHELREIVRFIYNVSNEDLEEQFYGELQQQIYEENKIKLENFIKKEYTKIKKSSNKFKKLMTLEDKDREFYFINMCKKTACVAEILIYNINMDLIKELHNDMNNYDENFFREQLILGINQEFADEISEKGDQFEQLLDDKSILNFIDLLDTIEINEDAKWKLIQVYKNPKPHYMVLVEIILKNEDAHKNAYKEVEQLVHKFIEDFQKDPQGKYVYIQETIGIKLNSNKLIIYPAVARFNALTMDLKDGCEILHYGILFDKLMEGVRTIGSDKAPIINVLKPLSDKSKFEIIRLLKNEEMYGQQIAEKLKLTTATVSYHMNDLVVANLVCLERRDSKVYYSLNRKAIKEFISELETYML
ncbi:ArsR/SmtB family transcription factor [Inconstantimicrobium mannanitabidum]|uniref:Transcriptional regulator n=1 Tax=Inconstantimicrobium mannanitabidum TaxID=1604901 RepID=A0ACB5RGA7_9CLOT|nr:winged helix-turn-helix domain-containing protein [Clostridium sp. TW13]GKX68126.1 transcriptional regulator [Clostridium sp. TW13]